VSIKQVEGVMDALFNVACAELKNNGMFTLAGWFRLKLKKQPATEEKWGSIQLPKSRFSLRASQPQNVSGHLPWRN
jgi:hypothetical protein